MGGPHPDWKDTDFFIKHPYVDIVVKNEGEIPFHQILIEFLNESPDFTHIGSLILPDKNRKAVTTGAAKRIEEFDRQSVWMTEDMQSLALKYRDKIKIAAVWETNRGCPYQCSFCDWGSATYTKIRHLPEERLDGDLEFFAKYKVLKIFIADSNFGMFDRDLRLAQKVVECKKNYGYPTLVYWATAKNRAEPVAEIAKAFLDSGLDDSVVVAMQSTQENTIVEMGRGAHSLKTHRKLSELIDQVGAPKIGQIILGSPGESAEEFKDSLHGMLELNFHRSFFLMNYAVLPNAPITHPDQMRKYEIKTITRPANRTWGYKKFLWKWKSGLETIIVGHTKMSPQDWVTMSLYKTHIMCLHHLGLTKYAARLLHNLNGVPYGDIYRHLFDSAVKNEGYVGECYRGIQAHFADYLENTDAIYALPGIDDDWYIDHESALFCRLMVKPDEFLNWMQTTLLEFSASKNLPLDFVHEILNYQKNMTITPDYDSSQGRTFRSNYDFHTYFAQIKDVDHLQINPEKKPVTYLVSEASRDLKDQILNFKWMSEGQINLKAYQHSVIVGPYRRYMSTPLFEKASVLNA
jgi:putative methyltransferase